MNETDKQWHDLMRKILHEGDDRGDRTGTGTRSIFGHQMRFDLSQGFPAVTTKKLFWRGVVVELLWFLRGETNTRFLEDYGVQIWKEWADKDGELGPVYGSQWRSWGSYRQEHQGIDQIAQVIEDIKTHPYSRRHVVSAWNVDALGQMALPPCHTLFQFYVSKGKLSCMLYQRSADVFLGLPFNIASYALLTHMIAKVTGLEVGEFIHTIGDAHLYNNHMDQVEEVLSRDSFELPTLELGDFALDLKQLEWEPNTYKLVDYQSHGTIKAPIAI